MKKLGLALMVLLMSATAGGCALTKDYVTLQYVPEANVVKQPGAENVSIKITMVDERRLESKPPNQVSCKKNAYGMEMAQILSKNDVMSVVHDAFASELQNRGFNIGAGGVALNVKVITFWNDFKVGMWSGSAAGELIMAIQVEKPVGTILNIQSVTGRHLEKGLQLTSGENAKMALDGALRDAVSQVMRKNEFIDALLRGGTSTPVAPVLTSSATPLPPVW